ncbi:tape measure protein [Streptococcus sinensis]|uniref:tape measure protein n=1 Tax=Streptococcus sinensis TaxID=176090 RepID=UPI00272C892D|nr:tape measure protein [Streptococcus sinensis]
MADGSVTIKVDMDGSSAQSGVSKLKSLFGGLESAGSKVGSVFKSVLGANLISSALTTGISIVTGGIRDMASELTSSQKAWKTFEGNLQAFGRSTDEIKAAKTEMQDFATKTIYSASDMASTYSQLDAVGTKNVGSLVKAFGGLAASAENPAQAMKSLSTQATQMASKPKVAWMDFKIMMEQAPAGVAAVAKEMGMSTAELVAAVQDGKIKTEDFFDAMNRAGNSDAFQKMATEFKTVDQAIDGAKESLSNKLMPAFEKLNQFGIKAVNALSDALEKINFDKLATDLGNFLDKIDVSKGIAAIQKAFSTVFNPALVIKFKLALDSVKGAISTISQAFQSAGGSTSILLTISNVIGSILNTVSAGAQIVQKFMTSFANTGAVKGLKSAFDSLVSAYNNIITSIGDAAIWSMLGTVIGNIAKIIGNVAAAIGNFIADLDPSIIQGVTTALIGLLAGFKGFKIIEGLNPFKFFAKSATDSVGEAVKGASKSKGVISQLFTGLSNVIKASGTAIKAAATGIGQGIKAALSGVAPVIRAFGAALKTAGVANILAFGGAVAIAAVGIGAGVAIIAAGFALLASQGQGVATIINAVGQAFATVATAVIGAFAQAIVTVAGVLPTVTSALANLAPLVIAFGQAFAAAAPFVTALGEAISSIVSVLPPVISTFTDGVANIVTAVTPIVEILGNVFTSAVQIVADVVVQIVQALAPFMPAVVEIAQALAPVLQSIAEAFTALINQISPIINSIANLFTSLGDSIKTVLDGAKGVIEGFGNAVKSILDGIAGIFDSIGNAALNAGRGFKLLAQGVVMITNTKLGDMAASLAAVATGVGAISAVSGGMASAGAGMKSLGQGMVMVGTAGTGASGALGALAGIVPTVSSTLSALGPTIAVAGTAMRTFAASAIASFISLSASAGHLTAFNSGLTSIQNAIETVSVSVTMFSSYLLSMSNHVISASTNILRIGTAVYQMQTALYQTSGATQAVGQAFVSMQAMMSSAMTSAVAVVTTSMIACLIAVTSGGHRMVAAGGNAGMQTGQRMAQGIRSNVGNVASAVATLVSAAVARAYAGASQMFAAGHQIGAGLAQGMYSALGAVTAAANALVAQAERAAQAKAKIHSPSRLFRDNVGRYIAQGIAVGIENNTSDVTDSLAYVQKEMSAFKFGAEELLGLGNSTLSSRFRLKSITERAEMSQIEIIRDQADQALTRALEVAEQAVKRPVNMVLDDGTLVAKIGEPMTNYQNDKLLIDNMMRGIV